MGGSSQFMVSEIRKFVYHLTMSTKILSAVALLLLSSCSKTEQSANGVADADVACASNLVGTWSMISVMCGSTDVTQDIHTAGGISDMRIEFGDTAPCRLVSTASGPTCTEVEAFDVSAGTAGTLSVVSRGITSCQPAQCVFNANDAPCVVGDRASDTSLASLKLQGGNLTMTSQPPGLCGQDVATILTYVKS